MKNIFLLIGCWLSIQMVFSQDVKVIVGNEVDNPNVDNYWTKQLGSDETGHYLLREFGPVSNKDVVLEKYDANFNLLFSKDIESSFGFMGDSKNHFETVLAKERILVFLNSWKKETEESGLWVQAYTLDGEKSGEPTMLITEGGTTFLKSSSYKISVSPDKSKFAVLQQPTFTKGAKESLTLKSFEASTFEMISEKEFTFETEMKRYPRNQVFVNNQGTAFAFKEVKVSGKEFKYYLASKGSTSEFSEELNFALNQVNQTKFIINSNNELVGFGILAEAKKYITQWQKTWQLKANNNGIVKSKIEPLGANLLGKLMIEKKASKPGALLNYFQLKDVLEKPEGGYLLLTEYQDKRKTAIEGQPNKYTYKYNYGNILALSFTEEMTTDWNSVYSKSQVFNTKKENMEMGSFAYGILGDKLAIVYNYTAVFVVGNYANRFWKDKSGVKIKVKDVFGEEALFPTFFTSMNLKDGSLNYSERTFSALPLGDLYLKNNFGLAIDPSYFFSSEKGITLISRMKGESPKKIQFSTVSF